MGSGVESPQDFAANAQLSQRDVPFAYVSLKAAVVPLQIVLINR